MIGSTTELRMSAFMQILMTFVGAMVGIAIASGLFKRNRGHLIRSVCMAIAIAFTIPIYRYLLEARPYGLLLLPLLGGLLGGTGWWFGEFIERRLGTMHTGDKSKE